MANECGGEFVESLEVNAHSFVTEAQPPVVVEPGQTALHHPAGLAQSAAMGVVLRFGQSGANSARARIRDVLGPSISVVPLVSSGAEARTSPRPLDGRNRVEQGDRQLAVGHVGGRGVNGQGGAARIRN